MSEKRESFGSKIGAVLVAAGSAVGLGSIWRFPYVAGENGGGAFIFTYLVCMVLVGIPIMLAEFAIGSHTRKGAVGAYGELSKRWKLLGFNSIFVSMLISGFYYIVAGWSLEYFMASIDGSLYASGDFHASFESFRASWRQPFYTIIFIVMTHCVVAMGVKNGLERTSKVMMPALFLILVIMALRSAMMPGALQGYRFLFEPDFEKALTMRNIVGAMGQAFFSLSIGLGCMIAYSSFFKRGTNLTTTAASVCTMTLLVAVLSGMVIFPAVFSVEGLQPAAGPTLIFETLPFIFKDMPMPALWSGIFFLLLSMAALTSTISFHETMTLYLHESWHLSRQKAATAVSVVSVLLSMLCIRSSSLFDAFDMLSADVFMPLGGLMTAVFAGWVFDKKIFRERMADGGNPRTRFFGLLLFLLRWVCPISLSILFFYNLLM